MGKYKDEVNELYERYKNIVREPLASQLRDKALVLIDERTNTLSEARIGVFLDLIIASVGVGLSTLLPPIGLPFIATGGWHLANHLSELRDVDKAKRIIVGVLSNAYRELAIRRQSAVRDYMPSAGGGEGGQPAHREAEPIDTSPPGSMVRPRGASNERLSFAPQQRNGLYSTQHTTDEMVNRLRGI